jgi:hypothetical protein
MTWLILASVALLLVVGSSIALWWWKLAARMAPYQDEIERHKKKAGAAEHPEVEVISRTGSGQK